MADEDQRSRCVEVNHLAHRASDTDTDGPRMDRLIEGGDRHA